MSPRTVRRDSILIDELSIHRYEGRNYTACIFLSQLGYSLVIFQVRTERCWAARQPPLNANGRPTPRTSMRSAAADVLVPNNANYFASDD